MNQKLLFKKFWLISSLLVFLSHSLSHAEPKVSVLKSGGFCAAFLADLQADQSLSYTDRFLSFVVMLLDQGVIDYPYVEQLSEGRIYNPIPKLATNSAHDVYRPIFEAFIKEDLEKARIVEWAKAYWQAHQKVAESKTRKRAETQSPFLIEKFLPVEAGSFVIRDEYVVRVGNTPKEYSVTLTHPFEMMTTPVTQDMWVKVMGKNPSQSQMGGDYPIENITWWSAVEFANRLSIRQGLTPTYDLSQIGEWKGDAELGTLIPKNPTDGDDFIRINAPNHDIYRAQGYRLPTIYEQLYVQSDRGRSTTDYFSGVTEKNLIDYAWYSGIFKESFPVSMKLAFRIDGHDFYDFYGNICQLAHDSIVDFSDTLRTGVDPVHSVEGGMTLGQNKVCRFLIGGDYGSREMTKFHWRLQRPEEQYRFTGFRLVRTLK